MATIQIEAKDLTVGDVVIMNANCAWRVEEILPGTDKTIEYIHAVVQYFGASDTQLAKHNEQPGKYKHRLATLLKVHRGN